MSYLLLIDVGRDENAQQQNVSRIVANSAMIMYGPSANNPLACSVVTGWLYLASAPPTAAGGFGGGPTWGPQFIVLWCVDRGPAAAGTLGSECEMAAFFSAAAACTAAFIFCTFSSAPASCCFEAKSNVCCAFPTAAFTPVTLLLMLAASFAINLASPLTSAPFAADKSDDEVASGDLLADAHEADARITRPAQITGAASQLPPDSAACGWQDWIVTARKCANALPHSTNTRHTHTASPSNHASTHALTHHTICSPKHANESCLVMIRYM